MRKWKSIAFGTCCISVCLCLCVYLCVCVCVCVSCIYPLLQKKFPSCRMCLLEHFLLGNLFQRKKSPFFFVQLLIKSWLNFRVQRYLKYTETNISQRDFSTKALLFLIRIIFDIVDIILLFSHSWKVRLSFSL